jgi:FAD/FMN-containing dehydrogenase
MSDIAITRLDGKSFLVSDSELKRFKSNLAGKMISKNSSEYEESRAIWNRSVDKKPSLIIECIDTDDVITCIKFVNQHRLLTAIRGGGHNVAGNALCDEGVVIDLSKLNQVNVDTENKSVTVGGGATINDVDSATLPHNLAVPLGIVSETGIGGLTLCGGHSWLTRKYGFACDNILSVEIVTADGQLLEANENQNPELFWAIRGGGGNFGVVTKFEFKAHPISDNVVFCGVFYPISEASSVYKTWRDYVSKAPNEFTSQVAIWSIPHHDNFPTHLHGEEVVIVSGVYDGSITDGELYIKPLREIAKPLLDLSGPIPYGDVQKAFDPYFTGKRERFNFWKSLYLENLSDEKIEQIVQKGKNRPNPWTLIPIRQMGGEGSDMHKSSNALGGRDAPFMLSIDTSWTSEQDTNSAIAWTRSFWDEMQKTEQGAMYLNFVGDGEDSEKMMRKSYGEESYERLLQIKLQFDPENMFRLNQNIRPAKSQANS